MTIKDHLARLAEVSTECGGPSFTALDDAALDTLEAHFDLPAWLREAFAANYPDASLAEMEDGLFPPLRELFDWYVEDKRSGDKWPREWMPLRIPEDHRELFIVTSEGEDAKLRSFYNSDNNSWKEMLESPPLDYRDISFRELLQWASIWWPLKKSDEGFEELHGQRFLSPKAEQGLRELLPSNSADKMIAAMGVPTAQSVRKSWESEVNMGRTGGIMTILFALVLLGVAFAFVPGAALKLLVCVMAAIPLSLGGLIMTRSGEAKKKIADLEKMQREAIRR